MSGLLTLGVLQQARNLAGGIYLYEGNLTIGQSGHVFGWGDGWLGDLNPLYSTWNMFYWNNSPSQKILYANFPNAPHPQYPIYELGGNTFASEAAVGTYLMNNVGNTVTIKVLDWNLL
jgi:hypothetical protein